MPNPELEELKRAVEGLTQVLERSMQAPPLEKITKDDIRGFRKVCRLLAIQPPPGEILHMCWPPPPPPPIPGWWWRELLEKLEKQLENG